MPLSDPSFFAAEDLDREISNMSTMIWFLPSSTLSTNVIYISVLLYSLPWTP